MGKKKNRDEIEIVFEPEPEDEFPELDAPAASNALLVTVDFMALVEFHDGNVKTAYDIVANLRDLLR